MTMTDTTEVVLMTITGGRMNPTGTLIEIPGMDVVSQNQQVNIFYRHSFLISIIITFEYKSFILIIHFIVTYLHRQSISKIS